MKCNKWSKTVEYQLLESIWSPERRNKTSSRETGKTQIEDHTRGIKGEEEVETTALQTEEEENQISEAEADTKDQEAEAEELESTANQKISSPFKS